MCGTSYKMNEVEKLQNAEAKDESEMDSAESQQEENKYLTFWIDGELFGIPISDVVQIISMQKIIPLPDFPAYAKGIINLRGNIVPVIDMRIRLKRPEAEYNESTCIVVTNIHGNYIGFIVDTVDEVTDINNDKISPPPKVTKEIVNRYLTGIGQIGKKVVLLLDVSKIFSDSEFDEVTETAQEATVAQSQVDSEKKDGSPENGQPAK